MSGFTPSYESSSVPRPTSPDLARRSIRGVLSSPGEGPPPTEGGPGEEPSQAAASEEEPIFPPCWWCGEPEIGMVLGAGAAPNRHFCAKHDGAWRIATYKDLLQTQVNEKHEQESDNTMAKLKVMEYELPELGWHDATLTKVTEKTVAWQGEESECFEWHYELGDGNVTIRELSSQSFSTRSKAYIWASALLEIEDELDTDDLTMLPCRVKVTHKPPNANGQVFPKITEVRARAAAAAAEPKAEKAARKYAPIPVPAAAASEDEAPF